MSIALPVLDSNMEKGGGFCSSPFFNVDTSWNTTEPDFTPCFQKTVVLWIPCAFLVLLAPIRIYHLTKSQAAPIPFTVINILKTVLAGCIALVMIADIIKSIQEYAAQQVVPTVNFVSPLVVCLTMVLAIILIHQERKHGVQSSGYMVIFWILFLTSEIFILQSKIRMAVREGDIPDLFRFITFFIAFPLFLGQFILTFFVDRKANTFSPVKTDDKPCPEHDSSFLSRITFWWFTGMVIQGYKHALERKDLFGINPEDSCSTIIPHFDKYWQKEIDKEKRCKSKRDHETPDVNREGIELKTREENGDLYTEVEVKDGKPAYRASLLKTLIRSFWSIFLLSAFFKFLFDILQFLSPLILKLLIQFTKDKMEYVWRGYFYAVLMLVVNIVMSLILHQYFYLSQLLGMRLRTAIIGIVYKKMLTLSNAARRTSTVGEIVNLMSVDAQRFMDLMTYFHTIWSGPFQISVALYFLWQTLGPSVMAGTGVMIVMIPINAIIAKKSRDYQMQQMRLKDSRIKLMNEVLNGIKVLKLYAWEKSFEQQVLDIRNKELVVLKRMAYLNAAVSFTWTTAPFLVSLVTFAVYVLVDSDNILDAEKAFVSLSLFNILRFPLSMLPQVISNIVQASVSLKRLQNFLNNEELDPQAVSRDPNAKHAITIEKGTFTWERDNVATLRHINLEVPQGSLVAVVGTVGSGKSSILSAILGEMDKVGGHVNVKGSMAYVAQQAWIQNATLQDNILFGKAVYQSEYDNVVEACALKPDLEILPAGDKTEIGEKGINLSGGQKQRVSLARAVYQNADVYLMDDPLSAVDSHVGKHIFEHVIGPTGILRDKTRILVTHGISFLPKVDLIVVLVDGQISEVGTFQELIGHAGAFAEFLKNYLSEELGNEDEQDLEEIEDLKMAEEIVSQLGSIGVIEDERTAQLQRQVSKFSSRVRTFSDASKASKEGSMHSLDKSLTAPSTSWKGSQPLTPWKGSQPKFPEGGPATPILRQKAEHHTKEEKETEALKKQVQEKSKEEKLIKEESVETGNVRFAVFLAYLKSVGALLSVLIILFYVLYNVASVYSNIWLSEWSDDETLVVNGTVDTSQRDLRLGVYGALGLIQGFFVFFGNLALYVGCVGAASRFHALLLGNILAVPIQFFDVTPLGRVVNRFSKDIDIVDTVIAGTIEVSLHCILRCTGVPVVVGLSTPWFLVPFVPLLIFYCTLQYWGHEICVKQFTGLLVTLSAFVMAVAGLQASYWLFLGILQNLLRSPMMFFDTHTMGCVMNRFSEDIAEIDFVLPFTMRSMLNTILQAVGSVVVMVSSTPAVAVAFPLLGPPYFFCQRFYVATSRQLKRLESVSRSPIYSHFGETVTGVATIRAYGQQDRFISMSDDKVDENLVSFFPSMIANRWLAVRLEFVANSIVFFATLFAVIGRDSLSPGIVGLSITYALNVTQTLNWLVRMTCELETNIVAVERVKEYSETPTEAAWEIEDKRPNPDWPDHGVVEFKDYGTRYREGLDLVLKGISCKIEPGEKIGIVGRTGAGKSSLTMALFRIIEKAMGNIIIDGIDISTIGLHDLRSKLTIIPQEPVLFSGTLRMNLDPFNAHTDEQLWQALQHAHLKDFVSGLPAELQHECAEGGENLSVGQRQLVCLARALLRKTKILVLDEATAAVDLETDDLIQNTIRTEFADCTILTIAHRLNTIMDYNKIMVLDAGKVSEFDEPQKLLQDQKSLFYCMAKDAGLVY